MTSYDFIQLARNTIDPDLKVFFYRSGMSESLRIHSNKIDQILELKNRLPDNVQIDRDSTFLTMGWVIL
jgi:hypothetical protein